MSGSAGQEILVRLAGFDIIHVFRDPETGSLSVLTCVWTYFQTTASQWGLTLSLFLYLSHLFTIFNHFSALSISSCFRWGDRRKSTKTQTCLIPELWNVSCLYLLLLNCWGRQLILTGGKKQTIRQQPTESCSQRHQEAAWCCDLLHEAEAVDGVIDAVISIFPGIDLHAALPALETQKHPNLLAWRRRQEGRTSWILLQPIGKEFSKCSKTF